MDPPDGEAEDDPLPPPPQESGDEWRDELGLPYIEPDALPYTKDTFTQIIEEVIHQERAFLQLHKDQPEVIAQRLDELTRIINALLAHHGPHLPQVIRLALELEPRYWVARSHKANGMHFFEHLFSRARDWGDPQLLSEVLAAWGLYMFLLQNRQVGRDTLRWALEEVEKDNRPDLRLLLCVKIFNAQVLDLPLEEVEEQAANLLAEASRLNFPYAKGRVYYSLSRRYQHIGHRARAFEYAQQSLCYFYPKNTRELATQALGNMYVSLTSAPMAEEASQAAYAQYLLEKWEQFAMHNINPWYRAAALHIQAHQLAVQGLYHHARHAILRAWLTYRSIPDFLGCAQAQHTLGMLIYPYLASSGQQDAQTPDDAYAKLRNWERAEYHLRMAQKRYEALGETAHALRARHARAYLQLERAQDKWELLDALRALKAVYKAIETHLDDPEVRGHMLRLVAEDIASAKRRLACGGNAENVDGV